MRMHFQEDHPEISTLDPFKCCAVEMIAKIDNSTWNAESAENLKKLLIEWDIKLNPQLLSFKWKIKNSLSYPKKIVFKPGFKLDPEEIIKKCSQNLRLTYNSLRLAHNLIEIPLLINNSNGKTFEIQPLSSADRGVYLLKCRFCSYIKVRTTAINTGSFCEDFFLRHCRYGQGRKKQGKWGEKHKDHILKEHDEQIHDDSGVFDHFSMILLEKREIKDIKTGFELVKKWENRLKGTIFFNFSQTASNSIVQNVSHTTTSSNSTENPRKLMLTGKRSQKITSYFSKSTDCDLVKSKKRKNEECQESAPKSKKSRKNSIAIN